jgi:hypothetical protein
MGFTVTEELIRAAKGRVRPLIEAVAEGVPRASVFTRPDGRISFILLAVPDFLVPVVKEWLDAMNGGPPEVSGEARIPTSPERN